MEFTDAERAVVLAELEKNTAGGKAITSGSLHELISGKLKMPVGEFKPKLSKAVNSDEIIGYEGVRKVGYRRKGSGPAKVPIAAPVQPVIKEKEETLNVGKATRIRFEAGCWSLEKLIVVGESARTKEENIGEERWVTCNAHYGSLLQALEALLTRHSYLLGVHQSVEIKTSDEIKELIKVIREGIETVKQAVLNREAT